MACAPLATLTDAIRYFADAHVALELVAALRWPDGVLCPHCKSSRPTLLKTRCIWKCRARRCHKQFSVRIRTIFEDSPLGLETWLPCLWALANGEQGIGSRRLARALGITQKSAWFMLHRVRLATQTPAFAACDSPRERVAAVADAAAQSPIPEDVPVSLERLRTFTARILAVPKVEIDRKAREWTGRGASGARDQGVTAFKTLNEGGREEK